MRILIVVGALVLLSSQAMAADAVGKGDKSDGLSAQTGSSDQKMSGAQSNPLYKGDEDTARRKGHESDASAGKGNEKSSGTTTNPLYEDKGTSGVNPLHKGD